MFIPLCIKAEPARNRQESGRRNPFGVAVGRDGFLFPRLPGKDVSGNLFADKHVKRLVVVERRDHVVAIAIGFVDGVVGRFSPAVSA